MDLFGCLGSAMGGFPLNIDSSGENKDIPRLKHEDSTNTKTCALDRLRLSTDQMHVFQDLGVCGLDMFPVSARDNPL